MNRIILFSLLLIGGAAGAQPAVYTAANLHSHNDYEQLSPFRAAYDQGFGSIEADIFLQAGDLVVAHDTIELKLNRRLDSLYLQPLQQCIKINNGYPYTDHHKMLQLLIDVKRDSTATLNRLVEKLQTYPLIINCTAVKVVISGNRPASSAFAAYPAWIYFDGELSADYPAAAMGRIAMLSDNFRKYSLWDGSTVMPAKEKKAIEALIAKAHQLHKTVRFWNAPDLISSWKVFMQLGVDYINTDHIPEAAAFLKASSPF